MKEGAKCLENDPLGIKILLIYDGIGENTAAARTVRELKDQLSAQDVVVVVSENQTTPSRLGDRSGNPMRLAEAESQRR